MTDTQTLEFHSLAPSPDGDSDPVRFGLPLSVWFRIGVIASLTCALFWPNLRRLWEKTNPFYGEANWQHATAVPLIGLYYLYVNRDRIRAIQVKTAWTGLLVVFGGILVFTYGIWPGQNDFVKDLGMVITLGGLVLLMTGWRMMKIVWFPIAFLVCALPWPGLVYSWVASPLQQLAANVAVYTLQLTGVRSSASGTKIIIFGHNNVVRTLNVAEACAGLRSLMTFITLAGAVAFLSARPLWQKCIVVFSAIPIAISCNVMRVAGQGLLDHYVSQQLSENFAHQFVGLIMLIPAFLLILLVGWVLDKIFLEEAENPDELMVNVLRRPQVAQASAGAGNGPAILTRQSPAQTKSAAPVGAAVATAESAARHGEDAGAMAEQATDDDVPAHRLTTAGPTVKTAPVRTAPAAAQTTVAQPAPARSTTAQPAPARATPAPQPSQASPARTVPSQAAPKAAPAPTRATAPSVPARTAPARPSPIRTAQPMPAASAKPQAAPTRPVVTPPPPSTRLAPRTFSPRGVPPSQAKPGQIKPNPPQPGPASSQTPDHEGKNP